MDPPWITRLSCLATVLLYTYTNAITRVPLYQPGNTTVPDGNEPYLISVDIGDFPFYGRLYSSIYISKNGMIGFTKNVQYKEQRYSKTGDDINSDEPFIAPFHFRYHCGTVYYRILQHGLTINNELSGLGDYIQTAALGVHHFYPTWGIVLTWDDVREECSDENQKYNTFQAILMTDGHTSFVIFYYVDMQMGNYLYYQSGFNGGYGQGWTEAIPYDQLNHAHNIPGSDAIGRYVFQVNEKFITRWGCVNFRHNFGTLNIFPKFAGMFGGEMLDLSGPCFQPNDKIICKFGDDEALTEMTSGFVLNVMRARCTVPRLLQKGRVKLELSIDQGKAYYFKTIINMVHPLLMKTLLHTDENEWNTLATGSITLTWNADDLTDHKKALMDIRLIGYFENSNRGLWSVLRHLGENIPIGSESHVVRIRDHPCIASDCTMFDAGFIEVRLRNVTQATKRRSIKSVAMPLGWFKNTAMVHLYERDWAASKCSSWYDEDLTNMRWFSEIPDCPCTLYQALVDKAGWIASPNCNMFTGSSCSRHQGVIHCVSSMQLTFYSAGNECCYSKEGNLIYIQDTEAGSVRTRSDIWGWPPYIYRGYVPYMSYVLSDAMPFYFCCVWSDVDTCKKYRQQRKTTDCRTYEPPGKGMIYGQSHYRKFDGTYDRVCGVGDFILLEMSNVIIEGRFERNLYTTTENSVSLSAIAVLFKSDIVEIYLKPPTDDRSDRDLDVIVNGEYVIFQDEAVFRQDFTWLTVLNSEDERNTRKANLTIVLQNGIAIEVADTEGRLFVVISVTSQLKGSISGLMGNWNGQAPGMQSLNESLATYTVAMNLGEHLRWKTGNNTKSIFRHAMATTNKSISCDKMELSQEDVSMCEGEGECIVDLISTRNATLANSTKYLARRCLEINAFAQKVISCGVLEIDHAIKDTNNYTSGSSVTISGCTSGHLEKGDYTYTCQQSSGGTAAWQPEVNIRCIPTEEVVTKITTFIGIAAGCLGIVFTCAQLATLILLRKLKVDRLVCRRGRRQSQS